jgi:hypothetical protein
MVTSKKIKQLKKLKVICVPWKPSGVSKEFSVLQIWIRMLTFFPIFRSIISPTVLDPYPTLTFILSCNFYKIMYYVHFIDWLGVHYQRLRMIRLAGAVHFIGSGFSGIRSNLTWILNIPCKSTVNWQPFGVLFSAGWYFQTEKFGDYFFCYWWWWGIFLFDFRHITILIANIRCNNTFLFVQFFDITFPLRVRRVTCHTAFYCARVAFTIWFKLCI